MQPVLHVCNKNLSSYYDVISGLLQCCKSRIRNAMLCLVVYASSCKEAEAGGSPWIQGQTDLWRKYHISQGYIVKPSFKQAGEQKKVHSLKRFVKNLYYVQIVSFLLLSIYVCIVYHILWAKQNKYFSFFLKMWRLLIMKHPVFYLFFYELLKLYFIVLMKFCFYFLHSLLIH